MPQRLVMSQSNSTPTKKPEPGVAPKFTTSLVVELKPNDSW